MYVYEKSYSVNLKLLDAHLCHRRQRHLREDCASGPAKVCPQRVSATVKIQCASDLYYEDPIADRWCRLLEIF